MTLRKFRIDFVSSYPESRFLSLNPPTPRVARFRSTKPGGISAPHRISLSINGITRFDFSFSFDYPSGRIACTCLDFWRRLKPSLIPIPTCGS